MLCVLGDLGVSGDLWSGQGLLADSRMWAEPGCGQYQGCGRGQALGRNRAVSRDRVVGVAQNVSRQNANIMVGVTSVGVAKAIGRTHIERKVGGAMAVGGAWQR